MLNLINYSEKSVALVGDTKEIKETLKKMGGKFNPRLSCGAGWIFKASKSEELLRLVNGGGISAPNLKGMKVYVGTYKKYNSGSLEGAWIDLSACKDKDEFYEKCKKLHKDEEFPELMFQDWEGVPSWFINESYIDPELWNYKEEDTKTKQSKDEKIEILDRNNMWLSLKAIWSPKNVNQIEYVLEVEGMVFVFEKGHIQTHFCHPDEPSEAVEAFYKNVKTYEYFRKENCYKLEQSLKDLEDGKEMIVYKTYKGWTWQDKYRAYGDLNIVPNSEEMSEKVRCELVKTLKFIVLQYEERLQAWWKRYGYEKLHVWTYWQNA